MYRPIFNGTVALQHAHPADRPVRRACDSRVTQQYPAAGDPDLTEMIEVVDAHTASRARDS
jgi:hypothetical protein